MSPFFFLTWFDTHPTAPDNVRIIQLHTGAPMSDEKTVFISYRRSNSSFIARAVFQDLRANGYDVFMDVESIDAGAFSQIILNQIAARAHFIVILAPGTLDRCSEPGDWLRSEIEEAMRLERNIIPLLFSEFRFKDAASHLSGDLTQLQQLNALNVPHDYFDEAMAKLRNRFLKQPVFGAVRPTPAADLPEVRRKVAEAASESAPTKKQLSAEDYFRRAWDKDEKGNYSDAIDDLTEAIRLNPQYAAAYYNRGLAYHAKGDLDREIADYDSAIRLNPQYTDAYNNRGIAYRAKGNLDRAISDYDSAIRLNPQYMNAYNNRGSAYKAKGDFNRAIADYDNAIRLNPQNANAYNNRGVAYQAKGDYDRAISDYDHAIRFDPRYDSAYYNRGIAYQSKGDWAAAVADFQKYLDLGGGRRDGDQAQVEGIIADLKKKLKK